MHEPNRWLEFENMISALLTRGRLQLVEKNQRCIFSWRLLLRGAKQNTDFAQRNNYDRVSADFKIQLCCFEMSLAICITWEINFFTTFCSHFLLKPDTSMSMDFLWLHWFIFLMLKNKWWPAAAVWKYRRLYWSFCKLREQTRPCQ